MRLWHMLSAIALSALVFGFVRLVGMFAIATAIGMALVAMSIAILVYSENVFDVLGRSWGYARARSGRTRLPCMVGVQTLFVAYLVVILVAGLVLCGILVILLTSLVIPILRGIPLVV